MPLLDPHFATRRHLKVGLVVVGALAGAAFGVALTILGKIVAGAPPATMSNYIWNAAVFGVVMLALPPAAIVASLIRLSRAHSQARLEARP